MCDFIGKTEKMIGIVFYALSRFDKTLTSKTVMQRFDLPIRDANRLLNRIYEIQHYLSGVSITKYRGKWCASECTEYIFSYE